jgi:hypothetical protein
MAEETLRQLRQQIEERKAQVETFVEFGLSLIQELGTDVRPNPGSHEGKTIRELVGFAGFSFRRVLGMTSQGGNYLEIRGLGLDRRYHLVVKVYWQAAVFDADECKVEAWCDESWVAKLHAVYCGRLVHIAEFKTALAKVSESQKRAEQEARQLEFLKEKAERLGLAPS